MTTKKQNYKILAIIPARGGSKGIPRKNITILQKKPLVTWTIEAAKKSRYIDKVVVSSEDEKILNVAKKFGAQPIKRPNELATDTARPELSISHALQYLSVTEKYISDILIYLQPTSPLRDASDIDDAISTFLNSKATALNSVYETEKKHLKAFFISNRGFLKGIVNDQYPFMNRQQLPSVFMPNGAIYIIYTTVFKKTGMLFSDKTMPYLMAGEKNFDLDTMDDLKTLRKYLKNKYDK